jgi:hypothetical protein
MITSAMSPVSSTNALLTSDPFAVTDTFVAALVLIRSSAGPRALPPAAATPQSRGSGVPDPRQAGAPNAVASTSVEERYVDRHL